MMTATISSREKGVSPVPVTKRKFRLAYLTTEYPKVSHTFIRREIVELERRGHTVIRLAIRHSGGAVADEADQQEFSRTFHCLSQPVWRLILATLLAMVTRPLGWWRALRTTLRMCRRSDRGLITHLAYLAEAALLLRVIRREQVEHLHVHFGTNSAAVARLIRALGGPPYSMTVHGPTEFDSPYGFSLGEKVMEASFVVAISDYCAAQLRRWTPHAHWDKIHIVHCTVGRQFFDAYSPIPRHVNTLVCVGRLSAQKGQHLLIEAMQALIEDGVDVHLILAGDGEMRQDLEAHIEALDLQKHITITGWIDEQTVRRLVSESRALVQPSFAEGLPVVIMEAMAMGRPVISTVVAAIPELVRQGETGWLLSPGNLDDLIVAMKQAMQAPIERLDEMGAAARELVLRRHHTTTETSRLEALFDEYIPRPPARSAQAVETDVRAATPATCP